MKATISEYRPEVDINLALDSLRNLQGNIQGAPEDASAPVGIILGDWGLPEKTESNIRG